MGGVSHELVDFESGYSGSARSALCLRCGSQCRESHEATFGRRPEAARLLRGLCGSRGQGSNPVRRPDDLGWRRQEAVASACHCVSGEQASGFVRADRPFGDWSARALTFKIFFI